jgi:lipopolysaccharide export system protein LptC
MAEGLAGPLSAVARAERSRRRAWAMPGSSHDRLIAVTRVVLPAAVGVLAVALAATPLTSGRDISFVLNKNHVAVAPERMRVMEATYRGEDQKGETFAITAQSAVQKTSADPVVKLDRLAAKLQLQSGPATLVAPKGSYNLNDQKVGLDGPVKFKTSDGLTMDTRDVQLDMQTRKLAGNNPVQGTMPLGQFRADRMQADLDNRVVVLDGNAHLHITQRSGRAPK